MLDELCNKRVALGEYASPNQFSHLHMYVLICAFLMHNIKNNTNKKIKYFLSYKIKEIIVG